MSRGLTSGVETAVTGSEMRLVYLVKAEFDSGDLRLWSGVGEITHEGEIYTGAGNFLGISSAKETSELEAQGMTYTLTGVNSAILSMFLTEEIQNRPITCWSAIYQPDSSPQLMSDPVILFRGRMDLPQLSETGENTTIGVQAESRLIDFNRKNVRRYTSEDQKALYAGDLGCDFVATLQDIEIVWGKTIK
jgi:hypothetical protein